MDSNSKSIILLGVAGAAATAGYFVMQSQSNSMSSPKKENDRRECSVTFDLVPQEMEEVGVEVLMDETLHSLDHMLLDRGKALYSELDRKAIVNSRSLLLSYKNKLTTMNTFDDIDQQEYAERISSLESEVRLLRSSNSTLTNLLQDSKSEIERLRPANNISGLNDRTSDKNISGQQVVHEDSRELLGEAPSVCDEDVETLQIASDKYFKAELNRRDIEIEKMKEELRLLKSSMNELNNYHSHMITLVDTLCRTLSCEESSLLDNLKDIMSSKESMGENLIQLRKSLAEATELTASQSSEISELEHTISGLEGELADAKSAKDTKAIEVMNLRGAIETTQADLDSAQNENVELTDELQNAKQDIKNSHKELRGLACDLEISLMDCRVLRDEVSNLKENVAILQSSEISLLDQINILQQAAVDLYTDTSQEQAKYQDSSDLTKQFLIDLIKRLRNQSEFSQTSFETFDELFVQINEEVDNLFLTIEESKQLREKFAAVNDDLTATRKEMAEMQKRTVDLIHDELSKSCDGELAALQNLYEISQKKLDELSKEVFGLQEELINTKNSSEKLRVALSLAESNLEKNEEEVRDIMSDNLYKTKLMELDSQTISRLNDENKNLKEMLAARESDLQKAKDILEVGGASIANLREELSKFKKLYKTLKAEKLNAVKRLAELETLLMESTEGITKSEEFISVPFPGRDAVSIDQVRSKGEISVFNEEENKIPTVPPVVETSPGDSSLLTMYNAWW